jgi:hypothetical protein
MPIYSTFLWTTGEDEERDGDPATEMRVEETTRVHGWESHSSANLAPNVDRKKTEHRSASIYKMLIRHWHLGPHMDHLTQQRNEGTP